MVAGTGKRAADISLESSEINATLLASKINVSGAGPGAIRSPARQPRERSWDGDAITRRVTLVKLCSSLTTLPPAGAIAAQPFRDADHPRPTRSSPHPPLYGPPRALSVPDPVSTMDELSVAR